MDKEAGKMIDFHNILNDTVFLVRLMNNKVIHVNGKNIEDYYDDDSVKLITPARMEFQPKHLKEFYSDYETNLEKGWEERIDNVEEFYDIWKNR